MQYCAHDIQYTLYYSSTCTTTVLRTVILHNIIQYITTGIQFYCTVHVLHVCNLIMYCTQAWCLIEISSINDYLRTMK